jgi:hypothetical protein
MQPWVSTNPSFPLSLHMYVHILGQFAEALLSLANLTADEGAREALYARAQVEGDDAIARELGPRPTRTPRSRPRTIDVRMDES